MPATIQLRVEPALNEKIKAQAARQNISANKLLINAINLYLEAEKEREWREGFEAMGRDPDTNNVDFMLPAAREVVLGE
ncbi:MAG: toxin-antitoxin system HicB family antitoxin [Capsulimonas sp.]|uniref:toxin-antitoxin system HicB family antitoxin n=1 Tax=Capsulimonas sp. TaxID=2494211 RepID=UPI0032672F7F